MPDIQVSYDPAKRVCDLVFNGRDFALDATPVSAMLISLGTDRRARADDALPDAYDDLNPAGPASLLGRRGWCGDALDGQARLVGSRLWLLNRQKASETVRKSAEQIVAEAMAWLNTERGLVVDITVRWARLAEGSGRQSRLEGQGEGSKTALAFRVRAGASVVSMQQSVLA